MSTLIKAINEAKKTDTPLFYNSSGSKQAYQLGIRHISSTEFLGFTHTLPNGDLLVIKPFCLVDFEKETIIEISKQMRLTPIRLAAD